jgi:hypothetical protein
MHCDTKMHLPVLANNPLLLVAVIVHFGVARAPKKKKKKKKKKALLEVDTFFYHHHHRYPNWRGGKSRLPAKALRECVCFFAKKKKYTSGLHVVVICAQSLVAYYFHGCFRFKVFPRA